MGQTSIRGVVYPPSEISNLDFDLVIISISEYAEEIRTNLINKYGLCFTLFSSLHFILFEE